MSEETNTLRDRLHDCSKTLLNSEPGRSSMEKAYIEAFEIAMHALTIAERNAEEIEQLKSQGVKAGKKLAQIRATTSKIAGNLASAGKYTHRDKNEAILDVVARLLHIANEPHFEAHDMDDILF